MGAHFKQVTNETVLKSIKKAYQLPDKFFFFLGNTDPKKNTKGVLEAYGNFSASDTEHYKLVILDYDENELQKLLMSLGMPELRKNIHLLGYVPNTELPAIISQCTIFLYPSLRESFGIPILEGMACGAPVITSNTSSMPEVAGKDAALIVDPFDAAQITAAIQTLVDDNALAAILSERGILRAKQFSWVGMSQNVLELYQEVYKELNTTKG